MSITVDELVRAALACELVDEPTARSARRFAGGGPEEVVEHLSVRGRLPAEALFRAVARGRGLEYVDLGVAEPETELIARLPQALLGRAGVLPVRDRAGRLVVATADPDDRQALETVRRLAGARVEIALAEPALLASMLERALGGLGEGRAPGDPVALLDRILKEAYLRRASDIHLEPMEGEVRVRVRIDGILREITGGLDAAAGAALISRVKVLAELDIAEQRAPQDGGFRYAMPFAEELGLEIRVATVPTEWGERATLRLLGIETRELDLGALGMAPCDLDRFAEVIRSPYGLVLLTGPTGSGKSTTLYAALQEINHPAINVMTVEDPVEYRIAGVNQVHVGGTDKVTFASALRSLLRHDPDVLMVGEVRDLETADAALKAAMTGHLVFSTLHTNSACAAVGRLADIGCEPFRIGATLKCVVAQRLVRRLCTRCAERREASAAELEFLGVERAEVGVARGCATCVGTGYRGRLGLFETLWVDRELGAMISRGCSEDELERAAGARLRTLREDAREKALARRITVEEACRATVLEV